MPIVAFLLTLQAPLLPQPREYVALADMPLRAGVAITPGTNADDRFAVQDLSDGLRARGVRVVAAGTVGAGSVTPPPPRTGAPRPPPAAPPPPSAPTLPPPAYARPPRP